MQDHSEIVRQYYDENAQREWERFERHPFEFALTTRVMDRYIRPGERLLDIGGGPGRYSVYFAQKGCALTLVDLSAQSVALAQQKAAAHGVTIRALCHNCLELDALELGEFDHVFLMGPLYHLKAREDRERAVRLALEKLRPGGLLYASFILNFAGFLFDMKNGPDLLPADIRNGSAQQLLDAIVDGTAYTGPAFTDACFVSPRQIRPFLQPFGLEEVQLFGQEGVLSPLEPKLKTYPEAEQAQWLDVAEKLLPLPEFLAYSEHAMYIGRKPISTGG